jgi:peptidoglycan/xylan/chitin deacetylase (PgdA/CDA1 family)
MIVSGSFFLVGYLQFAAQRPLLELSALRYRLEYAGARGQGGLMAAVGGAFSAGGTVIAQEGRATAVPVLTYHSIIADKDDAEAPASTFEGRNVSLARFKDQMFALKEAGWQAVSFGDFEAFMRGERDLPKKSFLLTFDDGAKDSFYPVDPILSALGYRATAFILPKHSLGSRSTYYLNRDELGLMLSTGRWDIQSHGQDVHASVPVDAHGTRENALSNRIWLPEHGRLETHEEYAARITSDLAAAKSSLQDALGIEVRGFAFPFGDYGQNGSNDPEAEAGVLAAAREQHDFAFYQQWGKREYSFNYPDKDAFLIKRRPVDPSLSGAQLLGLLEGGKQKALPYSDSFATDGGWQGAWGGMSLEDGALRLFAAATTTGSLAFLDGSYLWDDYRVNADVEWKSGYAMVMFDLQSDNTGRACVFSPGRVQLQERTKDKISVLREAASARVSAGAHAIGAVSSGSSVACVFDGETVINAALPPARGGIGFEAWDESPGTAELIIEKASVDTI